MELYDKLLEYKNQGIPCMTVTVVKKTGQGPLSVGKKMLVAETGEFFGTVGGGAIEFEAIEHCKSLLKEQKNDLIEYLLSEGNIVNDATTLPMACGGRATLFFEYIGVKAHVYLFGAGHVSQALAKVLKTMNFHLTVIDDREDVIGPFVGADRKCQQSFTEFIDEEGIREGSYVVVCTPSHKFDYRVMDKVFELGLKPRYIGMLCSKNKLKDYLTKTFDKFGRDIDLSNFYSPIGLNTGGGSPAEIAVSIAAEMLAIVHNKEGNKHMRGDYLRIVE